MPSLERNPGSSSRQYDISDLSDTFTSQPQEYRSKNRTPKKPPYSLPVDAVKIEQDALGNYKSTIRRLAEGTPSRGEEAKEYLIQGSFEQSSITLHKELYEGYRCRTATKGDWFLILPEEEDKLSLSSEEFVLNGARKELWSRRNRKRATLGRNNPKHTGHHPVEHEANILFFLANWGKIVRELYQDTLKVEGHLPRMYELELNDYKVVYDKDRPSHRKKRKTCGSIDFLGFGPDKQGVIVDFGNYSSKKSYSTHLQKIGVSAVIRDSNHGEPTPPITTFIGEYHRQGDDLRIIRLLQPLSLDQLNSYLETDRS